MTYPFPEDERERNCFNCIHFTQPPCVVCGLQIGDCKNRLHDWYYSRGFGKCMQWVHDSTRPFVRPVKFTFHYSPTPRDLYLMRWKKGPGRNYWKR